MLYSLFTQRVTLTRFAYLTITVVSAGMHVLKMMHHLDLVAKT